MVINIYQSILQTTCRVEFYCTVNGSFEISTKLDLSNTPKHDNAGQPTVYTVALLSLVPGLQMSHTNILTH